MGFVFDNTNDAENDEFSYDASISHNNLCIIIDMQEGFRDIQSEVIVSNIHYLIEEFNSDFVFTQFINAKNSLFENQLNWTKFQNDEDIKIMREFDEYEKKLFKHNTYSIFTDEILSFIKERNYKKIYLAGIYTDVTVKLTALEGFDRNFNIFVISDACNTLHGKNTHNTAIESIKHIIGKDHVVVTSEM